MITFNCSAKFGKRIEKWSGFISRYIKHDGYYEILIESRSGIMVIFGKTTRGGFACMPDFETGCHLVSLKDKFWNTEKLTKVLGKVDGITVAEALYALEESGAIN